MITMQIYAKEVEFWSNDSEFLQQMEAEGLYPPRFILQVSGRQAHQTTCAAIHFKGATKPMKVDLLLEPGKHLVCKDKCLELDTQYQ